MSARSFLERTRQRPWGLVGLTVALLLLLEGCTKSGPGPGAPGGALKGTVAARADGFDSRPGWAEPGQAWSKSGETLVVVGYAKVRGDQRMEMAFRVSDSYARAELLRFLTVRVTAVLTDEESSSSSAFSEEDRRLIEERITTESEALIDQWFVSARYWEKRKDGGTEALHVFSRLEVERTRVEELLQKSLGDSPDLRLAGELSRRLAARWPRMTEVTALNETGTAGLPGVQAPEWARAGDGETEAGFTFVCQARADDERTAEALARARCNEKLCQLFGVQITAKTTVKENLEELTAESEVTEQCADVRAVGRKTTNRSSECTDEGCVHWLKQTYPRAAYVAEVERQQEPTIIRQEVVVQEGTVRYRDPAVCEQNLRQYSAVQGQSGNAYEARLRHLTAALQSCQGIDGRDSGLFASLNLLLTSPLGGIVFEQGRGADFRGLYAAVPAGFTERLLTERFLTTRIQMVRDVVKDAVFPMQLIDATMAKETSTKEDAAFEALIRRAVEFPLDDKPISKWHLRGPHAILLGMNYGYLRYSPAYRAFLLKQLGRPDINCDRPDAFDAEQVAGYLRHSDKKIDDEEYAALLAAFRRAPSVQMDRCLGHLVDEKRESDAVRRSRVREMARLVIEGKLVLLERTRGPQPKPTNVVLFERVVLDATTEERLELFLEYHTRLTGSPERLEDYAEKITIENFGGLAPGRYSARTQRKEDEILSDCRQMAGRYRAIHARAPELLVTDTDVCECLRFPALEEAVRKELTQLWSSLSDRTCKHFRDDEWPGGNVVWPYETRRWTSEAGTPFRRIPQILRSEYTKCQYETGIDGVRFSPTIHATLEGRILRKVKMTTQTSGTLRNMTKRGEYGVIVRVEDVERAKQKFEGCFSSAAEGYEIAADQIEKAPGAPRRVWIEFGDQGVSHGYE